MTDKFYKLTHNEWMRSQALKPAERDVLFYLKTLDPFGDGVEVVVSEIAIALGRNKGTISRALKVLANGDWVDLEMIKVKVKVKSCVQTTALCTDNSVVYTQPEWPVHNSDGRDTTCAAVTQPARPVHNDRPLEPTPSTEPTPPKTLKTYSDFLQTLSHEQRESFKKFVMKKVLESPFEIASPQAWNNKHWPEYWEEFISKYPTMGNSIDPEGKISPARVDEKRNILERAIANGEIQNFDRKSNGDYIIQSGGLWLEWYEWQSGVEADPEKAAATQAMIAAFVSGGESCR